MKKLALYSLPLLACLLLLGWFRRSTATEPEATDSGPGAEQVAAHMSPRSAAHSALAPREVPFANSRPAAPRAVPSSPPAVPAETSRKAALRAPVIDAIRADLTGEQKRKAMVDAIRSSGESDEEWTAEAEDAFETWTEAMPKEARGGISVAEPRCYAAGCVADVTFTSAEAYRVAAKAFRAVVETRAGHGGRVQTPFETQGKRVVASWIMLRPQDI